MKDIDISKEQLNLDQTIERIEQSKYYLSDLIRKKKVSFKTNETLPGDNIALSIHSDDVKNLGQALRYPYFGNFEIKSGKTQETFYIGKQGIRDTDENIVVVDWRMPIASVFYNFTPGNSKQEYKIEIKGRIIKEVVDVLKKSQIEIEKRKVVKIIRQVAKLNSDQNITLTEKGTEISVTDDILKAALENSETSGYLKEIIATIQREQDIAIRQSIHKNLIIQGVAGSGKSSIALHRLSYLIYNHNIDKKKLLILVPSELFINSVQGLLPGLELDGIQQSTFKQLVMKSLQKYSKLDISDDYSSFFNDIMFNANTQEKYDLIKFKGSKEFAMKIVQYVESLEEEYERKFNPFVFDGEWLSKEDLQKIYAGYAYLPFLSRIKEFSSHVEKHFSDIMKHKINKIEEDTEALKISFLKDSGLDKREHETAVQIFNKVKDNKVKKLRQNFSANVKQRTLSMNKVNIHLIYKELLEDINKDPEIEELFKYNVPGKFDYFDLAPMYYLYLLLDYDGSKYTHIVIDEAQDLSYIHFAALKKITNTMTIIGDQEQSIFMDYGQTSWETVQQDFLNPKGDILLKLNTSYRSTQEVIEVANHVMNVGLNGTRESIVPFSRSGEKVKFQRVLTGEELLGGITETIHEWHSKYKRIAIISKDEKKAQNLTNYLKQKFPNVHHLSLNDKTSAEGIFVVASYNIKGMEFDGVILSNASDKSFPNDEFHTKLLYVVLTRAQQVLKVFYQDTPTQLLMGLLENESKNSSEFDDIL
ncbi:UvrD-helicase domain-containing protein [Paenisporosarcina sp. TG20]|uniref:HelD family protein n=1 Tax=Paenisporosarcina sp. TG20 TaxID=1211706 RepID=UPI00030A7FB2|nr:UvrD-helicase domain-containing protein [Paenisporosarcina sp. TG20]